MDPTLFKDYERFLVVAGIFVGMLLVGAGCIVGRLVADHVTVH